MIPRAKQLFMARIPDGEGKITPEVLHRGRAPSGIGVQNQFGIRSVGLNDAAGAFELGDQFQTAVEPCIRGNPKPTIVETCRLAFAPRLARSPQHRVTQPDRSVHPALVGIWATVREKIYKGLQKRSLHWRTAPVVNADDATQSACLSIRGADSLNDEIGSRMPSCSSIKKVSPFRSGMRLKRSCSGNGKCISTDCLAGGLLYC